MIQESEPHSDISPKTEFPGCIVIRESSSLGLYTPSKDSEGYIESSKDGKSRRLRFGETGRKLADWTWNYILYTAASDSWDDIKSRSTQLLEELRENTAINPDWPKLLEGSLRERIRYIERLSSWQEMQASNSSWGNVFTSLSETIYRGHSPNQVRHYCMPNLVNIHNEIKEFVQNSSLTQNSNLSEDTKNILVQIYHERISKRVLDFLEKSAKKPMRLENLKRNGLADLIKLALIPEHSQIEKDDAIEKYLQRSLKDAIKQASKLAAKTSRISSETIHHATPEDGKQPVSGKQDQTQKELRVPEKIINFLRNRFSTPRARIQTVLSILTITALATAAYASFSTKESKKERTDQKNNTLMVSKKQFRGALPSRRENKPTTIYTETVTATPVPEPTKTYREKFYDSLRRFTGIDFGDRSKRINFNIKVANHDNSSSLEFPFDKYPYALPEDADERERQEFESVTGPGGTSFSVRTDNYGNIEISVHSGRCVVGLFAQDCEVEGLRKLLEGDGLGTEIQLTDKEIQELEINDEVQKQQKKTEKLFIGSVVEITPEGGETQKFRVVDVAFIPHEYVSTDDPIDVARSIYPIRDSKGNKIKDANGFTLSRFDAYSKNEEPVIYLIFCGRTTDRKYDAQTRATWSRYMLILEPDNSQRHQQSEVRKRIEILTQAINTADERGFEHGEVLSDSIENQLREAGIEINEELKTRLRKLANETTTPRDLQCIMGTELTADLPGTEDWVDIGGLRITKASDLFYADGERIKQLDEVGSPVDVDGAVRLRINKVSMLAPGDIIAIDSHPEQPVGHVARVVEVWIGNDGKYHALVFDVNFANDGKARLVEITDENMDEVLANVAEGQSAKMIAIKSYTSYDDWRIAKNIQPWP
jgi:hypothetical protein